MFRKVNLFSRILNEKSSSPLPKRKKVFTVLRKGGIIILGLLRKSAIPSKKRKERFNDEIS